MLMGKTYQVSYSCFNPLSLFTQKYGIAWDEGTSGIASKIQDHFYSLCFYLIDGNTKICY